MKPWRNKKYLKYVGQRCMMCGNPEAVAHHIKGIGFLSGAGMKCADYYTYGLCAVHHAKAHEMRDKESQWFHTALQMQRAIASCVLQFNWDCPQDFVLAIGKMIDDGVLIVR